MTARDGGNWLQAYLASLKARSKPQRLKALRPSIYSMQHMLTAYMHW